MPGLLYRIPRLIVLAVTLFVGLCEAFMVLMTLSLLNDLTARGPDAADNRAENAITWPLGLLSIGVTLAIGIVLASLVWLYMRGRSRA